MEILPWYMSRVKDYARQAIGDPLVLDAARKIVASCPPYNDGCETEKIYRWILSYWRYTKSPSRYGVENLQNPTKAISDIRAYGRATGECEEMSVALAALLANLNHRVALVWGGDWIEHRGEPFKNFRHVWVADHLDNRWIHLDSTGYLEPGQHFGFQIIEFDELEAA